MLLGFDIYGRGGPALSFLVIFQPFFFSSLLTSAHRFPPLQKCPLYEVLPIGLNGVVQLSLTLCSIVDWHHAEASPAITNLSNGVLKG